MGEMSNTEAACKLTAVPKPGYKSRVDETGYQPTYYKIRVIEPKAQSIQRYKTSEFDGIHDSCESCKCNEKEKENNDIFILATRHTTSTIRSRR